MRAIAPAFDGFYGLAFLRGRDDGMSTAVGDGIVAFARIVGAVSGEAAYLLISRDLVEQIGQDGCVAYMVAGDFNGSDFQRSLVDPEMNLAPDPSFWTAMFAGVPLAFTFSLDACAID